MRLVLAFCLAFASLSLAHGQLENLEIYSGQGGSLDAWAAAMARQQRIDELSAKLASKPNDADLLIERAGVYVAEGNHLLAMRDLEAAMAASDAITVIVAAASQLGALDPGRALVHVNRSLSIHADEVSLLALRGWLLGLQGNHKDALVDLERALAVTPDDGRCLAIKGSVLLQLERYPEAIEALSRAIDVSPSAQLYFDRGLCHAMTGNQKRAVEDYSEAIRLNDALTAAVCERGRAYQALGRYADARADYEACRGAHPDDPQATLQLAWLLATCPDAKLRDGQRALAMATELCDPATCRTTEPLNALAAAYAELSNFTAARDLQQRAVDLSHFAPDFHAASLRRLDAYDRQEPVREARQPLMVLHREGTGVGADFRWEVALTVPAHVLGESYLVVSTLLDLCDIAEGGGTIHTALDGKPLIITRLSVARVKRMLTERRDLFASAIHERGSVRLAPTYEVATEGDCLAWGLLDEPIFAEQDDFQLVLTQGILRHRGVVVESTVVFRHEANTDILISGKLEGEQLVLTTPVSGGLEGTTSKSCTATLTPDTPRGPRWAQAFVGRGIALKRAGAYVEALADFDRAIRLDERADYFMLRGLLLATCPEREVRDGAAAIEAAERARSLSDGTAEVDFLNTLALAHAEAGNLAKAVELQRQVVVLSPEDERPWHEAVLRLFTSGRAYHEDTELSFDNE